MRSGRRPAVLFLVAAGYLLLVATLAPNGALAARRSGRAVETHPNLGVAGVTYLCLAHDYSCLGGGYEGQQPAAWPSAAGYATAASTNSAGRHNCTLYAAYRLAHDGVPDPGRLGDAVSWAGTASKAGAHVDGTPAVGAVAQWGGGSGHVAYVESVSSAKGVTTIVVTSDNYFDSSFVTSVGNLGIRHFNLLGGYSDRVRITSQSPAWPAAFIHFGVSPAEAMDKIITTPQGTSYLYDGRLRWIPDAETYWCLRDVQHRVVITAPQSELKSLGNGKPWVSPCFDPARILNHIVRESSSGAAYLVGGTTVHTVWHWIPDGQTYQCLVGQGHGVIQSNWAQINTLREEGPHATCAVPSAGAPVIKSIAGTSGAWGAPPFWTTVYFDDPDCDVVGGTWYGPDGSGQAPHDFGAARGFTCSGGAGSFQPFSLNCPGGPYPPGSYTEYLDLVDSNGLRSQKFAFVHRCS